MSCLNALMLTWNLSFLSTFLSSVESSVRLDMVYVVLTSLLVMTSLLVLTSLLVMIVFVWQVEYIVDMVDMLR